MNIKGSLKGNVTKDKLDALLESKKFKGILIGILVISTIAMLYTVGSAVVMYGKYKKNLATISDSRQKITELEKSINKTINDPANNVHESALSYEAVDLYIKSLPNVKVKSVTAIQINGDDIIPKDKVGSTGFANDANGVEYVLQTKDMNATIQALQNGKLYYNSIIASVLDSVITVRIYIKEA